MMYTLPQDMEVKIQFQDVGCRLLELQQLQVVERGQTTLVWNWVRIQEASPATRLLLHTKVTLLGAWDSRLWPGCSMGKDFPWQSSGWRGIGSRRRLLLQLLHERGYYFRGLLAAGRRGDLVGHQWQEGPEETERLHFTTAYTELWRG